MPTVYIETSIVGYLTARSKDAIVFQARQQLTRRWWDRFRADYDLFISQLVLDEAAAGDPTAAQERLQLLQGMPLLDILNPDVATLARGLLDKHLLPDKAAADAYHVAVAAAYRIDYLLTWNCKHIANATLLPRVYRSIREAGFEPPLIVTPEEFSDA